MSQIKKAREQSHTRDIQGLFYGTPGAIRTRDLRLRRPMLYPAEPRVHIFYAP